MIYEGQFWHGLFIGARALGAPDEFTPEHVHEAFRVVAPHIRRKVTGLSRPRVDPVFGVFHEINSAIPMMMYDGVVTFTDHRYTHLKWRMSPRSANQETANTDPWIMEMAQLFANELQSVVKK